MPNDEQKIEEMKMETLPPASSALVDQAKAESLRFMNPESWRMMTVIAQTFMQSGALPATIKNAAQLIMVLQAGREAGMQPIEAINAFYIVNGKLSLYGEMAIAQVLKAGHHIEWGECNDRTATVTITRGDTGKSLKSTFTMEMAKARGLTRNAVYEKFPENMLRFKAFHMTARFIVAEALHGLPIKEDLEGNPDAIETTATDVSGKKAKPAAEIAAPAPAVPTLEEAIAPEPVDARTPEEKKKAKEELEQTIEKEKGKGWKAKLAERGVKVPEKPVEEVGAGETERQRYDRLVDEELKGPLSAADEVFVRGFKP